MNINVAKRPLVIGLATGVLGTAGLGTAAVAATAFASHPSTTARTAQPAATPALMPDMAMPSAWPRPSAAAATLLTEAQARAIAERAAAGRAEQVVAVLATTGQAYSVWVDGANGAETKLVIDARTGKVLSKVSDPTGSPEPTAPADQADQVDQADQADQAGSPDQADQADPTGSPDQADQADPTDSPDQADPVATQAPGSQDGSGD